MSMDKKENESGENTDIGHRKSFKIFLERHYHVFIILLLLLVFSIQFFHFIINHKVIPQGDAIAHGAWVARIYRILKGNMEFAFLHRLSYPPLTYLVSCFFFMIFGLSPVTALLSQYIFCIVFLVSIYLLGEHFNNKIGGIASMALGLGIPYLLYFGERYFLDLPGAAMSLLALYFLLKTDSFKNTKMSVIFGFVLALAQLTKWNCAVFIIPSLIVLLLWNCRKNIKALGLLVFSLMISMLLAFYYYRLGMSSLTAGNDTGKITVYNYIHFLTVCSIMITGAIILLKRLSRENEVMRSAVNTVLAVFIGQFFTYPVYLFGIKAYFTHFMHQKEFVVQFNRTFQPISYFLAFTWNYPLALLLTLTGLIFIFIKRDKFLDFILLLISLAAGYIFTAKSSPLDPRYYLAIYGITAVIGGYWVGWTKKAAIPITTVLLIYSTLPFTSYFFNFPQLPELKRAPALVEKISLKSLLKPVPLKPTPPDKGDYHPRDVMNTIITDYETTFKGKEPRVIIQVEQVVTQQFNEWTRKNNLPVIRRDTLAFIPEFYGQNAGQFSSRGYRPALEEKRLQHPVYFMIFHLDNEDLEEVKREISHVSSREPQVLESFDIPGERKISVIKIDADEKTNG